MKKITMYIIALFGYFQTNAQLLQQCTTDNNNDGVTNTSDFLNLIGQFGQNCAPLGTVSSFTCSDFINSGTLIQGSKASNVSSIISYTGGNGGDHNGQVVSSTGVTGLYAALQAGSFTSGAGNLTYMIFGTPSSSGTASFAINIGGQTCTLTRTVNLPVGTITALTCASATNTGTLTSGVAASSVSCSVPYTSGNGGTYSAQTVSSTGVTGLTATLAAGTFASGAGSITYTISGTPTSSGTASFALNIGGQTCTLARTVNIGGQTGITAHSCGATNVHNPAKTYGTMTDQQGNTYRTIVIGTQEWMAENLRTTVYRNGNAIANVTDNTQWSSITTGAWCNYNNSSSNECPYGKLYNWYAVADPRNLCPTGWHVPTAAEWSTFAIHLVHLGGEQAGNMKSTGTQYWTANNSGVTNESGFSGLPGGYRYGTSGGFGLVGNFGIWWSSNEYDTNTARRFEVGAVNPSINLTFDFKKTGSSVRCLRD